MKVRISPGKRFPAAPCEHFPNTVRLQRPVLSSCWMNRPRCLLLSWHAGRSSTCRCGSCSNGSHSIDSCGRQRGLCAALEVPPAYLSQYKSGKGTHGQMSPAHLDTRYKRFFAAIARAGLPTVIPTAANDDGLCPGGTPLASAGGGPPQTAATVAPQPALLTVNMAELKNQGGDASITSLGAAVVADQRWLMARPGGGAPLHLRDGLRGRRAFALRRSSAMGGRIFEWWIQLSLIHI